MDQHCESDLLKKTLVDMLRTLDIMCKKKGIRYVIVAGTLLGAVRHGGFIPWDDDIDIAMSRADYERFIICSDELEKESLYFKCFEKDENYYMPFGKICKRGTLYVTELDPDQKNEVFIDVFPLDKASDPNSIELKIQNYIVKGTKAVIIRKKGIKLKSTSITVRILQIVLFLFSAKKLMKLQQYMMKKQNKHVDFEYLVNFGSNYNYKKQTMREEVYFPPSEVEFEGIKVLSPALTEDYLRQLYGNNYMELPPAEKRRTHQIVQLKV